jgi:hypothetical protein
MSKHISVGIERHLSVIYADDLRQEIDGKITIVGMYQSQMLVPAFPFVIPKLAILMTAATPVNDPFGKVTLKLLKDTELLLSTDLDMSEQEMPPLSEEQEEGINAIHIQLAQIIGRFRLIAPAF